IVSALFGTYTAGVPVVNSSPVTDVGYGSQTDGSLAPPIPTTPFRSAYLGPGASVSTEMIGSLRILDFSQKMINEQMQELSLTEARQGEEDSLREVLQTQLLNESGVNMDEELAMLIILQTAYSASARVVSAVDQMFQELLNSI
ncbi:MAG: hypothetical protein K9G62_08445, partial [Alphaproteobacteria bacterium]|nr:hypothetical protein [Alphaproteobacteria bacterium]